MDSSRQYRIVTAHREIYLELLNCEANPLVVCIDVEVVDTAQNQLKQVGIAIFNKEDIVTAVTLNVQEHLGKTQKFVRGKSDFKFGITTICKEAEVPIYLTHTINEARARSDRVFLAGHAFASDIKFLQQCQYPWLIPTDLLWLDTQLIHLGYKGSWMMLSLKKLLNEYGFTPPDRQLHNAGNDAWWTARLLHYWWNQHSRTLNFTKIVVVKK